MGVEESKEEGASSFPPTSSAAPSRPHDRHHPSKKAGKNDGGGDEESSKKTPSQRAFAECWKSKRKNESNPLLHMDVGGQELKFMDVRPSDPPTPPAAPEEEEGEETADETTTTTKLSYEIFWTGDLSELGVDGIESLKSIASDEIGKFGGSVAGEPRETGCMISMIGLRFDISEGGAWELGTAMFGDFGEEATEEEENGEGAAATDPAPTDPAPTTAPASPAAAVAPSPPVSRVESDDEKTKPKPPPRRRRSDDDGGGTAATPSRRAFASILQCKKENTSFPLMRMPASVDQTFTFMDVRSRSPFALPSDPTSLRYEMLWSGEIEPNVDVDAFRRRVSEILSKYEGGTVTGDLHEVGGCGFVPMVGMSFAMREDGAMRLGKDMFDDFGDAVDGGEGGGDGGGGSDVDAGASAKDEATPASRPTPAIPSVEARPPAARPFRDPSTTTTKDPTGTEEIGRGRAVENDRGAPSAATTADACPAHRGTAETGNATSGGDGEGEKDDRTPSQRAFGTCWESKERNEDFPLMTMRVGDQELKFMDVRPVEGAKGKKGGPPPPPNDDDGDDGDRTMMHYEMFWTGELSELDVKAFQSKVSDAMGRYDGTISGNVRETGCMISMVGLPFDIRERDAMRLGKDMFSDFGK